MDCYGTPPCMSTGSGNWQLKSKPIPVFGWRERICYIRINTVKAMRLLWNGHKIGRVKIISVSMGLCRNRARAARSRALARF
jgi:hypothetical protein